MSSPSSLLFHPSWSRTEPAVDSQQDNLLCPGLFLVVWPAAAAVGCCCCCSFRFCCCRARTTAVAVDDRQGPVHLPSPRSVVCAFPRAASLSSSWPNHPVHVYHPPPPHPYPPFRWHRPWFSRDLAFVPVADAASRSTVVLHHSYR
jgi:hypothetical protein